MFSDLYLYNSDILSPLIVISLNQNNRNLLPWHSYGKQLTVECTVTPNGWVTTISVICLRAHWKPC